MVVEWERDGREADLYCVGTRSIAGTDVSVFSGFLSSNVVATWTTSIEVAGLGVAVEHTELAGEKRKAQSVDCQSVLSFPLNKKLETEQ